MSLARIRFSLRTLILLTLLAASCIGLARRWNAWVVIREFEAPYVPGRFTEAAARLSSDKRRLFWRALGTWRMCDVQSGSVLWTLQPQNLDEFNVGNGAPGIGFANHDRYAVVEKIGNADVLNADDGAVISAIGPIPKAWLTKSNSAPLASIACAHSADGRKTVRRIDNGWIIEDPATRSSPILLPGHGELRGCAFSPDGSRVATASYEEGVTIFDSSDGRALARFPECKMARTVEFSADGEMLVVVQRKYKVWLIERRR